MPAINNGGNVHVDDVAVPQFVLVRNAVAYHFIDADTAGLGKRNGFASVIQARRHVPVPNRKFVNFPVNVFGTNTGLNQRTDMIHQPGVEFSGGPHQIAFLLGQPDSWIFANHSKLCPKIWVAGNLAGRHRGSNGSRTDSGFPTGRAPDVASRLRAQSGGERRLPASVILESSDHGYDELFRGILPVADCRQLQNFSGIASIMHTDKMI